MEEIRVKDIDALDEKYQIIDIRDEIDFRYGSIAGAINIPLKEIKSAADGFNNETLYIIMCKSGIASDTVAEELRETGLRAVNLKEGYYGFMLQRLYQKYAYTRKTVQCIKTVLSTHRRADHWD